MGIKPCFQDLKKVARFENDVISYGNQAIEYFNTNSDLFENDVISYGNQAYQLGYTFVQ